MKELNFISDNGDFCLEQPENFSSLYFPIAGEKGTKSCVTPALGGDSKLNQNAFLMEPVSIENLHNNRSGRNFWCHMEGLGTWSVTGASAEEESRRFTDAQDKSRLRAGFMWQETERSSAKYQLEAKVTSFVPFSHDVEIMQVVICNTGRESRRFTPTAAIPIYGRSADNIRDHRHVTSLLHQICTADCGVYVKPTLSFDERGHQQNSLIYYVCGVSGTGELPVDFYPTVEGYLGEGGTYIHPRAVLRDEHGIMPGMYVDGKEAMGGLHFAPVTVAPGESVSYTVFMGVTENRDNIADTVAAFRTRQQVEKALADTKAYWQEKVNVYYHTGDLEFDNLMRWVSFQPILRRIYGCSFLPHHDYGKGGRGWRDLWQDCLALLIMNPDGVGKMILDNYGGVRMDGTNATIIGEKQGEFIADRNHITRVWMDHGVWPLLTTRLYMEQTGDLSILLQKAPYFKDGQAERGTASDEEWEETYGNLQKTADGNVYYGSILEHLLLQNLCAFYEVGEHNHIRLRGADWNDAIDMAKERGESVAFTAAYAGNLSLLALYLRMLKEKNGCESVMLLKEMLVLLRDEEELYENIEEKKRLLLEYGKQCRHFVSGEIVPVETEELCKSLEHKAEWIRKHIRMTEWVNDEEGNGWFNSYYDNNGRAVEGKFGENVRMMLTGQVFTVMSETAEEAQVAAICKSADKYLYEKEIGGYRLNTNFYEQKLDMGRMFGFAYGEKENGAVFSHMTVMYANALYGRGFVREGHKALKTLADAALKFEVSRIYPGIPEYFNNQGRGMYSYLTGAASWYMLTVITEVFGVRGEMGDLVIWPKLLKEQFDENGYAVLRLPFAGKKLEICFHNPGRKDYGEYAIAAASSADILIQSGKKAVFPKEAIEKLKEGCRLEIELS